MIVLQNIKEGVYAVPHYVPIISEKELSSLTASVQSPSSLYEKKKWGTMLKALGELPQATHKMPSAPELFRCVVLSGAWEPHINSIPSHAQNEVGLNVEKWGWRASQPLTARLLDLLSETCRQLNLSCDVRSLRHAQLLNAKWGQGHLDVQEVDFISAISEATSYAVYNSRWNAYLSAQLQPTILSSAQLFASPKAAQGVAKQTGWDPANTVVVEVATRVIGLADLPQPPLSDQGLMGVALSQIARAAIAQEVSPPEQSSIKKKM